MADAMLLIVALIEGIKYIIFLVAASDRLTPR
jgi:hypothetical protein